jgi:G3E family GTPase
VLKVPVVALTGHLGAGKTTLLNHLLRQPGVRAGVIVNDFGDINVDATLVTGQIDETASIAGGCVCCLLDDNTLDEALAKLSRPQLGVDVVIVEASGIAEPAALASLIRFSTADHVRPAGLVDVVDAVEYFNTVDTGDAPPARFNAASLVVINKCDRLDDADREAHLDRIEGRIRASNPRVQIVRAVGGRIDPNMLFAVASAADPLDQLPFAEASRESHAYHSHQHAQAVTVTSTGPIDPGRLIDLLESPPPGAYRVKGRVTVRTPQALRSFNVNLVGSSIHIASADTNSTDNYLVAIGMTLDPKGTRPRLEVALTAADATPPAGYRRLQRYRRLSS